MIIHKHQVFLEITQEFLFEERSIAPGRVMAIAPKKEKAHPDWMVRCRMLCSTYEEFQKYWKQKDWDIQAISMEGASLLTYEFLAKVTSLELPGEDTLQAWLFDSALPETIIGSQTEPDGHDPFGWPSWLSALALA